MSITNSQPHSQLYSQPNCCCAHSSLEKTNCLNPEQLLIKLNLIKNIAKIKVEYGSSANNLEQSLIDLLKEKTSLAFSEEAINFCQDFSHLLCHDSRAKALPNLHALGFALRDYYHQDMVKEYTAPSFEQSTRTNHLSYVRLGRGLAFHFAPNNVDTLFLYSLFLSILAGNTNVVRLGQSSEQSIEQQVLLSLLNELLAKEKYQSFAKRLLIIRYEHDDDITAFFSQNCAVRVIWGGDSTINHLRSIAIPADAVELTFANKFSFAVLNAQYILDHQEDLQLIANNFVTDAFSFGQQACSSPRLIVWYGSENKINEAKLLFWQKVDAVLEHRPFILTPAHVSERFLKINEIACTLSCEHSFNAIKSGDEHSYIRLELNDFNEIQRGLHQGNGLFFELNTQSLTDVLEHCSTHEQSISSCGFSTEQWHQAILQSKVKPEGLCRIVSLGKALNFYHIWDGYDLIANMSRKLIINI